MSTSGQTIIQTIRKSYQNNVRPTTHAIGEIIECMVAMRDGIRLRTIVLLPAGEGLWPVLFVRTPYWQTGFWGKLKQLPEKIKIPVCIVAGWFDHHLEGTVLGYEKLNPQTKKMSRLIVGAWDHDFKPSIPGHENEHAALNINADMFYWFDAVLKEDRLPDPEVKTYLIGEDRWQQWDNWPIKCRAQKTLYLTVRHHAGQNTYHLSSDKPVESMAIEYQYDPDNPVFTNGGETVFMSEAIRGSRLQEQPGYRDDVISFISDVMTEDTLVAGEINVRLYVSSDCEDTCFTAKVMEHPCRFQNPCGYCFIQFSRIRHPFESSGDMVNSGDNESCQADITDRRALCRFDSTGPELRLRRHV